MNVERWAISVHLYDACSTYTMAMWSPQGNFWQGSMGVKVLLYEPYYYYTTSAVRTVNVKPKNFNSNTYALSKQ